jgi:hypothetical protein
MAKVRRGQEIDVVAQTKAAKRSPFTMMQYSLDQLLDLLSSI